MKSFHANGKLLITGEYLILKGAKSLAIPTKFGQSLHYDKTKNDSLLVWNSLDYKNKTWFNATFDLNKSKIINTINDETGAAPGIPVSDAIWKISNGEIVEKNIISSRKLV